jgi:iron complex transport system ATP-binding protein
LKQGQFAGIIGPNGSGKTTLFRGITNELKRLYGDIILNGKAVSAMSYKEKARNIAIVTQTIEAESITVHDYVLMGRIPHKHRMSFFESKADYAFAEKYMKLTDTWRLRDKYMDELSGGEQQLAGIARALTQEPQLLLLDEPTSHLDITHQVQVLNLIQKLNTQLGLTVLMIIHDLNLAAEYCDFLLMMKSGGMHIQGEPSKVLTFQTIEDVYNTVVVTRTNPISNKPVVFLVSAETLEGLNNAESKKQD